MYMGMEMGTWPQSDTVGLCAVSYSIWLSYTIPTGLQDSSSTPAQDGCVAYSIHDMKALQTIENCVVYTVNMYPHPSHFSPCNFLDIHVCGV